MDPIFYKSNEAATRTTTVHIYNQQLQLIYSGQYHEHKLRKKLDRCSLLFNVDNNRYFLQKPR